MSRPNTYDWDQSFAVLAEYGKLVLHDRRDYFCSQRAFVQQLRNQANKRQLSLSITSYSDWLLVELNKEK